MDVSKLNDFPPRIRVNLTSISATELIPSAELIITGSEDENSFFISNQGTRQMQNLHIINYDVFPPSSFAE